MPRHTAMTTIAACLLVGACADEPSGPPTRRNIGRSTTVDLAVLANDEIAAAVQGRNHRGEQEEMLKIEGGLPGFGGLFIDSLGEVVAQMKRTSSRTAQDVQSALGFAYGSRRDPWVKERMAHAGRADVRAVDFSLSELIGIEQLISRNSRPIKGFTGVGTHIQTNRVKVFFEDDVALQGAVRELRALGAPPNALSLEIMAPVVLTADFDGKHRPSRGGIILMVGAFYGPQLDSLYLATHGYNVRSGQWVPTVPVQGTDYFMLPSHAPNVRFHANGHTGGTIYQHYDPHIYGTVVLNPAWETNPVTCNGYTYCTRADVALGTRTSGQTFERKIGTSVTAGLNGNWGTNAINNWYPVDNYMSPDLIGTNGVHKSGYATGTTTGDPGVACMDVPAPMSELGGAGAQILLQCVSSIAHAGWGRGDSGAPVFSRATPGGPYRSIGIQVAGSGATYASGTNRGKCSAGTACQVVYQQWSNIEAKFGMPLYTSLVLP